MTHFDAADIFVDNTETPPPNLTFAIPRVRLQVISTSNLYYTTSASHVILRLEKTNLLTSNTYSRIFATIAYESWLSHHGIHSGGDCIRGDQRCAKRSLDLKPMQSNDNSPNQVM